jgi:hypothetical protein
MLTCTPRQPRPSSPEAAYTRGSAARRAPLEAALFALASALSATAAPDAQGADVGGSGRSNGRPIELSVTAGSTRSASEHDNYALLALNVGLERRTSREPGTSRRATSSPSSAPRLPSANAELKAPVEPARDLTELARELEPPGSDATPTSAESWSPASHDDAVIPVSGKTRRSAPDSEDSFEELEIKATQELSRGLPRLARLAVRAALEASSLPPALRRLRAVARRSRRSAALPALRLRAGTSNDQSRRMTPTLEDPGRFAASGSNALNFEAQMTWQLDRLLFTREELQVEYLLQSTEERRGRLIARVLDTLSNWLQARAASSDRLLEPSKRLAGELNRVRAEAELDVLTDGWFGAELALRDAHAIPEPGSSPR